MQAGCTEGDEDENETVELMAARLLKAHKEDVWGANRANINIGILTAKQPKKTPIPYSVSAAGAQEDRHRYHRPSVKRFCGGE